MGEDEKKHLRCEEERGVHWGRSCEANLGRWRAMGQDGSVQVTDLFLLLFSLFKFPFSFIFVLDFPLLNCSINNYNL